MNFQTMSKQRKFIMIAAAAGIISVFLPWITIGVFGVSQSTNGFHSYGIVVFLAFVAAGIISFMGDQTKTLDQTMWMAALATGTIALLFAIIFFTDLNGGFGIVKAGFGLWIAIVAAAAVIASAWLFKNPGDSLQRGFESLKKSIPVNSNHTNTNSNNSSNSSKMIELEKLIDMRNEGKISEEEYQQLKSKLL